MAKGNPLNYDLLSQIIASLKSIHGHVILNPRSGESEEQSLRTGAAIRFTSQHGFLDLWPSTGTWRITSDGYKKFDGGNALLDQVSPGMAMFEAFERYNGAPPLPFDTRSAPASISPYEANEDLDPPPIPGWHDDASYEALRASLPPSADYLTKMILLD